MFGHIAGEGELLPVIEKKMHLSRSFQHLPQVGHFKDFLGFYRQLKPNVSAIAPPLTDFSRKGLSNECIWGKQQGNAFTTLKYALMVSPVSKLSDMSKPFTLQTDTSVLLQKEYRSRVKKSVFTLVKS